MKDDSFQLKQECNFYHYYTVLFTPWYPSTTNKTEAFNQSAKKVIFTACPSGKFNLTFASRNVTCPSAKLITVLVRMH